MTETQLFKFPDTGQSVRGVTIDGKPWFVGKDIATVLGYANTREAVRTHVPAGHRRGSESLPLSDLGLDPQTVLISEPGMYRLIMRSNTVVAESFQEWVTAEVLPALREDGIYSLHKKTRRELAQFWLDAEIRAELAETKVHELEPKAAQADQHRAADGCIAVGDFANKVKAWAKQTHNVKILHQDVWDFLGDIGLIIRGNTVRRNQPTAFATEQDFIRPKETEYETSRGMQTNASPRLTPAGEGWAWDRAVQRIKESGSLRRRQIGGAA